MSQGDSKLAQKRGMTLRLSPDIRYCIFPDCPEEVRSRGFLLHTASPFLHEFVSRILILKILGLELGRDRQ
jgi:hypothetical protein